MRLQTFAKLLTLALVMLPFVAVTIRETPQAVDAQDSWQVMIWVDTGENSYLVAVNADGQIGEAIPTPAELNPDVDYSTVEVAISADNQYIVHNLRQDYIGQLIYGRIDDENCCTVFAYPEIGDVRFFVGGFEPGGSRFAVGHSYQYVEGTGDGRRSIENHTMLIMDAAAGDIVNEMPFDAALIGGDHFLGSLYPEMGEWTSDGVLLFPECYFCEVNYEGNNLLWNPDTGTISTTDIFHSVDAAVLGGTDEMLVRERDTRFPNIPVDNMWPDRNIIRFYPTRAVEDNGVVAYFDADRLDVGSVHWVGDGAAMLIDSYQGQYWDIVYRNGRQVHIDDSDRGRFFVGSPDGWFVLRDEAGQRNLYHYDLATLEATLVATFVGDVYLARAPQLGQGVEPQPFVSISPPDSGPTAQCDNGALPSRLVENGQGRVLAGAPNRIRSEATLREYGLLLGHIPSGAVFEVIQGPQCDLNDSIAWWFVRYDGIEGWTAEGQVDTYFVEPYN